MTTQFYDGFQAVTARADGPQSAGIGEISVRLRHLITILDECLIGPADSPDDLSALAWIVQSLDDIAATITGLAHNEQVTDASHLPPVSVDRYRSRSHFLTLPRHGPPHA